MWSSSQPPPPPPLGGPFVVWADVGVPPLANNGGWAGGTPDPASGLPGPIEEGIGPRQCNLTAHESGTDANGGQWLKMTLHHGSTGE
jgi:hypothetical protein